MKGKFQLLTIALLCAALLLAGCSAAFAPQASATMIVSRPDETQAPAAAAQSAEPTATPTPQETAREEEAPALPFAPYEDRAKELLAGMSLEEKVGQMFFARCPKDGAAQLAGELSPGGYILFDRDFEDQSRDEVEANIQSYQDASGIPLLIGVDEEGGTVKRVSKYAEFRDEPFLSPQALYEEGGMELIESDTREKAELLLGLGINVNLAPVCDVSTDPDDYIYPRAFGQDAQQTAEYVKTVVGEMNASGIGCTLKHFPGYGSNADTHTGIADDTRPYETFASSDFLPFTAGIDAGACSILVCHNIVECMDGDFPASLSPEVHRILREELDFTGVILTDDLYMDAIRDEYGTGQAAVLAVQAGNDMLISTDITEQRQTGRSWRSASTNRCCAFYAGSCCWGSRNKKEMEQRTVRRGDTLFVFKKACL